MTFSAFQKFIHDDVGKITVTEINNLISQNNYLSLYVKVLGEHISSLDTKLDELIVLVHQLSCKINSSDIPSTSNKPVDEGFILSKPCIQRPIEIDGFTKDSPIDQIEKLLYKKFSHLHIKPLNISNDFVHNLESNFADNIDSSDDPSKVLFPKAKPDDFRS